MNELILILERCRVTLAGEGRWAGGGGERKRGEREREDGGGEKRGKGGISLACKLRVGDRGRMGKGEEGKGNGKW